MFLHHHVVSSCCMCLHAEHGCCPGRYDLNEWLGLKLQMNLAPEAGVSQGMVDVDLKACLGPLRHWSLAWTSLGQAPPAACMRVLGAM